MDTPKEPRVVGIDRFDGGVIVSFADNRDAIYPASFLYTSLPLVQEIYDTDLSLEGSEDPFADDGASNSGDTHHRGM